MKNEIPYEFFQKKNIIRLLTEFPVGQYCADVEAVESDEICILGTLKM